jgi:glycosyltransferase involved in cell wall biosynthesis
MKPPLFSVILPLYKQVDHVETIVSTYTKALDALGDTYELVLIPNGPDDGATDRAQQLAKKKPQVSVHYLEKGGWGRAVKFGLAKARGQYLCYTNSARTEVPDLIMILKYAKVNEKVMVKATRIIRESMVRKIGSTIYNLENRLLFKTPIWDVNGTPKVLPRSIYESLTIESDDDLIDAEIMARVFKNAVPIIEIPVVATTRLPGKSTTNWKSAYNMYVGLWKLRKRI